MFRMNNFEEIKNEINNNKSKKRKKTGTEWKIRKGTQSRLN